MLKTFGADCIENSDIEDSVWWCSLFFDKYWQVYDVIDDELP